MKFINCLFTLGGILFLSFSTISCKTVAGSGETGTKSFLATKDLALKSWLNKRIAVEYQSMAPELIFAQEPLKEIKVRTTNLPVDAPPFNFTSTGISRRELMEKIANFWNLEMLIHTNAEGNPTFISATGKVDSQ